MNFSSLTSQEAEMIQLLRDDKRYRTLVKKLIDNYEFKYPHEIDIDYLIATYFDEDEDDDLMEDNT